VQRARLAETGRIFDVTVAWFLMGRDDPADAAAAQDWAISKLVPVVISLPGLQSADFFTPESASDPYLVDGTGPVFMLQTDFADAPSALSALATPALINCLTGNDGKPAGLGFGHDLLETLAFPVREDSEPKPRKATLSYVVRYHRPAENEAEFIQHYIDHHPPILGEFPDIRNVFCYVPLTWDDPLGLPREDLMLGNEVVFDSLDALNASLASEVRHKLREDYNTFPPFTGRNTHHAMTRRRLYPGV